MAPIDHGEEWQRLTALYSRVADSELQKIAEDPVSLTEVARQVLSAEIGRRGITLLPAGRDELELRELVTIRQFRDLPEALLARGSLESAGIESFLADDNMVRMNWFISDFVGGIKLKVKPENVEDANSILEQPILEGFDVGEMGQYQQPRCPKCQSLDVSFEELDKTLAYGSVWMGFPIPFHRKAWKCGSCGQQWRNEDTDDDGV